MATVGTTQAFTRAAGSNVTTLSPKARKCSRENTMTDGSTATEARRTTAPKFCANMSADLLKLVLNTSAG